jgi:hypothetical protein
MEIIFFAVVAALVLGRLYQVLGQNRGAEPPPNRNVPNYVSSASDHGPVGTDSQIGPEDDNVIQLKPRVYDGPGAEGILAISAASKGFSPDSFVDGARQVQAMRLR